MAIGFVSSGSAVSASYRSQGSCRFLATNLSAAKIATVSRRRWNAPVFFHTSSSRVYQYPQRSDATIRSVAPLLTQRPDKLNERPSEGRMSINRIAENLFNIQGPTGSFCQGDEKSFFEALIKTDENEGLAIIKDLINKKAIDLNNLNPSEGLPLILAASHHHFQICSFLLTVGFSPLEKDAMGRTLLFYIKPKQHFDQDRLQLVCKEIEAASHLSPQELWSMQDADNRTPLHLMAGLLTEEWLPFLKERKVDLNAIDRHGQTPLYSALSSCEDVKLLIQNGAKYDCVDVYGRTPLGTAIYKGAMSPNPVYYYNSAKILIEAGAVPDERCLNEAYEWGKGIPRDLAVSLLEKGHFTKKSVSKIGVAVQLGLPDQLKKLLQQGENPNWSNPKMTERLSLLEKVDMNGDILSFFFLLDFGIVIPDDFEGFGPLRRGLVKIYRNQYHSPEDRHEAIRKYLIDSKEKFAQQFAWNRDFEALSKELGCFSQKVID
jgi:hypothetical protein